MEYEELRKKYKENAVLALRRRRLESRVENGGLSLDRLLACQQEIIRLDKEVKSNNAFFINLGNIGDPAWLKIERELDMTMEEFANPHEHRSVFQIVRKVLGTVSMLIIGTWIIDSLRKK